MKTRAFFSSADTVISGDRETISPAGKGEDQELARILPRCLAATSG
ncbi:hypothetical protein SLEP1_g26818 [Rubroshorea leprosula]|uniref:Uncharacterized protein n=1 Tax=Rubroshorea leprosula TaxID=152421 RepID=A0AAV5K0U8_9ROSI|nr:hypothetical protein SLEP1_g26818 [Rubroshorea leprosula]